MSRVDRLSEQRHEYFLSFEKDFGSDLEAAKKMFSELPSENNGQLLRKMYLNDWIASKEAPIEQKGFQKTQIRIAQQANNLSRVALFLSALAVIISLFKQ